MGIIPAAFGEKKKLCIIEIPAVLEQWECLEQSAQGFSFTSLNTSGCLLQRDTAVSLHLCSVHEVTPELVGPDSAVV